MTWWKNLLRLGLVSVVVTGLTVTSLAQAKDYIIGAADVIAISVLDNRDLDTVVSVNPDGKIVVSPIGDIQAAGLTVPELTRRLTEEFAKKVISPAVTVTLREVNSYRIYFLGRVGRTGIVASKSLLTLLQGISLAGGIPEGTDLSMAYLVRGNERVPVDFTKLLRNGDLSQNITLEPDDTVVVPENPLNVVYMTGEVRSPGMLPYVKERQWTVLKAVLAGGGFTQFAAKGSAYIIREEGGRRTTIPIDFNDLIKNREPDKDVPLLPGDILVVPQSLF